MLVLYVHTSFAYCLRFYQKGMFHFLAKPYVHLRLPHVRCTVSCCTTTNYLVNSNGHRISTFPLITAHKNIYNLMQTMLNPLSELFGGLVVSTKP